MWLVGAVLVPALLAATGVFARAQLAAEAAGVSPAPVGRLVLSVRGDEVVLLGDVADEAERRSLMDGVRARAVDLRVTDLLTAGHERLPVGAAVAVDVVAAAVGVGAADFTAVFAEGSRAARATVADEGRAATLREALARNGISDQRVTVVPGDLDLGALQRSVAALVRSNGGFRFEPGTADWQGHGSVLVERVARLLLVAPRAVVSLNGHAGTEHPDPRGLAQQRAEVVRDLFVAQGVRPDRLRTAVTVDPGPERTSPTARQVDVLIG